MLTAKQNMIECMKGSKGNPDRYVNQFEAVKFMFQPAMITSPSAVKGGGEVVDSWGVTKVFPENAPGAFPVHTPASKIVIKDIENWKDYVKAPSLKFPDELWAQLKETYDAVDSDKTFKATFIAPGVFEQTHNLSELVNALTYFLEYEDEMHDLIKYITDWELELAEGICSKLGPDMIFHHDDWGGHDSTFMSKAMFEDFLVEPYKEIYGYYHAHGVDYIAHHSDSYAATLVPDMIEMGIDVWQGPMETNKVDELIPLYDGKISFMGCIENGICDKADWTEESVEAYVRQVCEKYGTRNFIPCIAQGGAGSVYTGVYKAIWDTIDKINAEKFGIVNPDEARIPMEILF